MKKQDADRILICLPELIMQERKSLEKEKERELKRLTRNLNKWRMAPREFKYSYVNKIRNNEENLNTINLKIKNLCPLQIH